MRERALASMLRAYGVVEHPVWLEAGGPADGSTSKAV